MLIILCTSHHEVTKAFAERIGLLDDLEAQLTYLDGYANEASRRAGSSDLTRCQLSQDIAPWSFYFQMERAGEDGIYRFWFEGALVYHGPSDGGSGEAPSFATGLVPQHGWSLHT